MKGGLSPQNMVGLDTSSPPVIFVVGTAGAGKSSLVTSFQRWSRFLETEAICFTAFQLVEVAHFDDKLMLQNENDEPIF